MFGTKGKTGLSFAVGCRALGLRDCGTCANALAVAQFLEKHPQVESVSYAGLESSKYNALVKKYCPKGASGLFTFSVKGGFESAKKVVNNVKMLSLIANLGDVRTLIAHPASMMHSQLTKEQQEAAGAGPSITRISVGIEEVKDTIADLDQALGGAAKGAAAGEPPADDKSKTAKQEGDSAPQKPADQGGCCSVL